MKQCAECQQTKSLEEFYRDCTKKDGRNRLCRPCEIVRCRTQRSRNALRNGKYAWMGRNKNKVAAYAAVRRELKKGTLIKSPCTICDTPEVQAHHIDYDYPLKVVWLCEKHHKMAHGK